MTKRIIIPVAVCIASLLGGAVASEDAFQAVKERLAEADCCRFEFLSIVESDVFDAVDTTLGEALVARDGRYTITIGIDYYLNDGEFLYGYSPSNNQVTIERALPANTASEELAFITRIDDYFSTHPTGDEKAFNLIRLDSNMTNLPDSMLCVIATEPGGDNRLDYLEYLDINRDRNRIQILSQEYLDDCDPGEFRADFADSVEVIKLY